MGSEDKLGMKKGVTKHECNFEKEKEFRVCFPLGSITFCVTRTCVLYFPNVSLTDL